MWHNPGPNAKPGTEPRAMNNAGYIVGGAGAFEVAAAKSFYVSPTTLRRIAEGRRQIPAPALRPQTPLPRGMVAQ